MMSRSRRQRRCGGVIVGVVSLSGIIIAITIPITIIAVFVASEWEPALLTGKLDFSGAIHSQELSTRRHGFKTVGLAI